LGQLDDQLLEDVIGAFLHDGKRQRLPCLIIGSCMAGRGLALFAPLADAFARVGPETGRQAAEQLDHSRFHRRAAL